MPTNPTTIEFFMIAKVAQEDPAEQIYLIRTRRNNGQWTTEPIDLIGTSDVRWSLNGNGVDERDIALASKELPQSSKELPQSESIRYAAFGSIGTSSKPSCLACRLSLPSNLFSRWASLAAQRVWSYST